MLTACVVNALQALDFVRVLGQELHSMKGTHLYSGGPPQLIFVIPPPGKLKDPASFTSSDMAYLSDAVDGFSLMTYDFSSPYSPGPNAPLSWVQQCLQLLFPGGPKEGEAKSDGRGKMLLGVNFYGNDYIVPQGMDPSSRDQIRLLFAHQWAGNVWKAREEIYTVLRY